MSEKEEEWRKQAEKMLDEVSKTPGEKAAILYFASNVSEYMKKNVPRELTIQTLKFLLVCVEEQEPKPETSEVRRHITKPEDGRPDKEHVD